MDESKAREIVQTYLDSNSSIRAMPLSHRSVSFRVMCSVQNANLNDTSLNPRVCDNLLN